MVKFLACTADLEREYLRQSQERLSFSTSNTHRVFPALSTVVSRPDPFPVQYRPMNVGWCPQLQR